ncbi:MAG: UvrD-helicase domain-containing protein [Desulfuromonadales bacterium]
MNKEQKEAVCHAEGPLLILAGAGSGKTRVITERIAWLLCRCGVPAESILAVTFTNKAAREMKARVEQIVGKKRCQGVILSTFHSLCVRLLREDIDKLGFKKNFSIYGTSDQLRLIKDLVQELNSDGRKFDADRILWMLSDAKNCLVGPEDFTIRWDDPYEHMAAAVYPRYQKALKAYNAVDFDDIIMLTVRLFNDFPEVLAKYQQRFRHLMVDEYQDTNAAQYLLLRKLAAGHGNLCVVGDDDQSIYGWRGADLGNIHNFERDFPGTKIVKLEQNYRSTGNILSAANAVINNNRQRKAKALWTADGTGAPLDYLECENDEEEAKWVAERIQTERFGSDRRPYSDFAVLFRTNVQSRIFEEHLRYQNIPYVLIGGQQFFDRKEVKDALAYLRVLVNSRDEVNLLRILNYPRRGIGATTADQLIRASAEGGKPLWTLLKQAGEIPGIADKAREAIGTFVGQLEKYRHLFRQTRDLTGTCRQFFKELKLEGEILRTTEDLSQARRRVENLHEVLNALANYEEREGAGKTLSGFLEKVSLLDDESGSGDSKEKKLARDAVTLMSLHSSKGLEYPMVFMVGMEEEFLPHKKIIDESGDIDEERRLCYVGMTRARQRLILMGCRQRKKFGQLQIRMPSRFLEEIPADLVNRREKGDNPDLSEEEQDKMAANFFSGIKGILED